MSSSRLFKIARGLLVVNFVIALLALISHAYSTINLLINGWGVPGMEKYSLKRVYIANFVGIMPLITEIAVYYFSLKALVSFMKDQTMTKNVSVLIERLVQSLFVLAILKILTRFIFSTEGQKTLFDHFMNSQFMTRQIHSMDAIIYFFEFVLFVFDLMNLFTLFLNPGYCLFYILVLKGMQNFYKEIQELKVEQQPLN
jgi:hypothetical protein